MKALSTGIRELDVHLSGGFRPGSTVTLVSDPTGSKDSLVKNFINSCLEEGLSVVYASILRRPETVVASLEEAYGSQIKECVRRQQLVFVNFLSDHSSEVGPYDVAVGRFFSTNVPMHLWEIPVKDPNNLVDISVAFKKAVAACLNPENSVVIVESVVDELLEINLELALKFDRKVETDLKALGVKLLLYVLPKGIRDDFILPFEQYSDYVLELKTQDDGRSLKDLLRVAKSPIQADSKWSELVVTDRIISLKPRTLPLP